MEEEETLEAQLPLDSVGVRLRRAREIAGLSRADIAASTKIPERHLAAIEEGDFAALPASTYAVGFSRSYARAVGLDEAEIASTVRAELDGLTPEHDRRAAAPFEPGDPARVPSSKLAWIAGLAGLIVIALVTALWHSYYAPSVSLPSQVQESEAAAPAATASPGAVQGGTVVFTALEQGVWVKFYDAAGTQLMQKEMALGESYTVPADAQGPQLSTARPQALSITIGGKPVPKLSETQVTLNDVPVTAAALIARGTAAASETSAPPAAATPQARRTNAPQRPARLQERAPLPPVIVNTPAAAPVEAVPSPTQSTVTQ